jgi:hypothetical protein
MGTYVSSTGEEQGLCDKAAPGQHPFNPKKYCLCKSRVQQRIHPQFGGGATVTTGSVMITST